MEVKVKTSGYTGENAWALVAPKLETSLGFVVFEGRFRSVQIVEYSEAKAALHISVARIEQARALTNNPQYFVMLKRCWYEVTGVEVNIQVSARSQRDQRSNIVDPEAIGRFKPVNEGGVTSRPLPITEDEVREARLFILKVGAENLAIEVDRMTTDPINEVSAAASESRVHASGLQAYITEAYEEAGCFGVDFFLRLVAKNNALPYTRLISRNPPRRIVDARELAIYLASKIGKKSHDDIAAWFKAIGYDSTYVQNVLQRIEKGRRRNPALSMRIKRYTEEIDKWKATQDWS